MTSKEDKLDALATYVSRVFRGRCVPLESEAYIAALSSTTPDPTGEGERQWTWQTCTEFAFFQTCEADSECPFKLDPPTMPLASYFWICAKFFGISEEQTRRAVANTNARRILDSRDEETDEGTRAKKSLEARRRANGLRVKVRALSRLVDGDSREENGGTTTTTTTTTTMTTSERERRRDAVEALEAEAENAVRRCAERRRTGGGRTARGAATSAGYDESHHAVVDVGGGASRDDDEDGDVEDPRILLRRQRETMDEQDNALDELSIVASRTRDVSLAVNDELDLHAKLLDGVEDEVEDTRERLTAATRAVRQMMRRGSNCRSACIATAVIALCFLIFLLIIKLQS